MSKIRELFENPDTVYVFDVDGVLVRMEFGEYNHYTADDDVWAELVKSHDFYENLSPIVTMQDFLKDKDVSRVYVATRVMNDSEKKQKITFLSKHYHILPDHVFEVYHNNEKLEVMKKVQEFYPELPEKYFVLVDDTVDVLTYVMENSHFSTVHNSTFLK